MPEVVSGFFELVEDHDIRTGLAQFPAFVEDLFYVALAPGRGNHFPGHLGQPLKPLPAHPLRKDRDRFAPEERGVIGPAAAEVPRRRPDRLLRRGVELSGRQPGDQTAEGRPHLVRTGRKPFAHQRDNPRLHPGDFRRDLHDIDPAETAPGIDRFILPGNPE